MCALPGHAGATDQDETGSGAGSEEHYVYVYRDQHDRPRYVGYGRASGRATSHLVASHNTGLNEFLASRQYRIEIAGPFDSEQAGRAVETTLISALKPDLNVDPGQARWRLRPLGVPVKYADRQTKPELVLEDFSRCQGASVGPVLFVILTGATFDDGRVGYDAANPPTDEQIRERLEKWWQLERQVPQWAANPAASPALLIGVFGSPGRQSVIASALIDRTAWHRAGRHPKGEGKVCVPLVTPVDLDAFGLRGRRISRSAGISFGGIPAQFFVMLGVDGVAVGGSSRRK